MRSSVLVLLALLIPGAFARPNIIFILTDDLGWGDYGVFFQNQRKDRGDASQPWHLTPQLDKMAAEGMQLPDHYCPAPVCAPSRASLLLGVHQGHANIRDNQFDRELADNHTLATVLKGAGYAAAAFGKWGLQGGVGQGKDENAAPADWPGYPMHRGFDFFHGYVRHRDGHAHYPKEDGKQVWENDKEISDQLDGCYTADLFTARAKKWIVDQRAAEPGKPFFVYLAFDTPHAVLQLPAAPYPEGGGLDGGVQWTGEKGRMLNTVGKPDSYMHPDYADAKWDHDADPATPPKPWADVFRRYATDVRRIDDCVGDLIDLLADLKIDDNTLVIFTSDNGPSDESYLPERYKPDFFNSFGPFDGIKRDALEGGVRVGAIARWPGGIKPGGVSKLPSQFHDWMATFAELAGVPAPAVADGTSLVPTLTGKGRQTPPQVYVEYMNGSATPSYSDFAPSNRGRKRNQMQMLRIGDLVGVRYNIKSHSAPFEIFNVVEDSQQVRDLAGEEAELQQEMHDMVLRLRRPAANAPRPYDDELVPAVKEVDAKPGIVWRRYESKMPWLARLEDLEFEADGVADGFEMKPVDGAEAALFEGLIGIPEAGDHVFELPAGQVGLLRIHEATVIDRGFAAGGETATGKIRLAAGKHPFRFYRLSPKADDEPLRLSGPSTKSGPLIADMLFHSGS